MYLKSRQWRISEWGPVGGPGPPSIFLDQTEPPPPLSQDLDDRLTLPLSLSEGLDPPLLGHPKGACKRQGIWWCSVPFIGCVRWYFWVYKNELEVPYCYDVYLPSGNANIANKRDRDMTV